MKPIDASTYWLSNDFNELTANSEDQLTSNNCSVPFEGKRVTVADVKNRDLYDTMVLTNSTILEPPYTASHYPSDKFKKVSLFEYSVITAVQQTDPETKLGEIFCATDKDAAHVSDVFRRMMDMAYTQNRLSLARKVATLPEANAYLVELLSGNHPHPVEKVKFLLQAGVDPDAGASSGQQSPLQLAVEGLYRKKYTENAIDFKFNWRDYRVKEMENYIGMAKALLDAGANPDRPNQYGFSPLQLAVEGLRKDFTTNDIDKDIVLKYSLGVAKALLDAGANPDRPNHDGFSPLSLLIPYAARHENHPYCAEFFEYLLNTAKADPDGKTSGKKTPLYMAALQKDPWCMKMLLEARADPNGHAIGRDTPLYAAAARGYPGKGVKTVPLLLEADADPDAFSTGKNTPLYGAIIGHDDSADSPDRPGYFVTQESFRYFFTQERFRYLEGKFVEDRFQVIKKLLDHNANIDAKATGKQTPLYAAATAYESDRGLVNLLLDKGADANGNAKGEETPLRHVLDIILANKKTSEKLKSQAKKDWFDSADKKLSKIRAAKAKELFKKSIDLAIEQVIIPLAACGADPDANTDQEEEKPSYIAKEIDNKKLSQCLDKMSKEFKKRH